MTDPSRAHPATGAHARQRRSPTVRRLPRGAAAAALVAVLVVGAGVANVLLGPSDPASGQPVPDSSNDQAVDSPPPCSTEDGLLTIAAAPEIVDAVHDVAGLPQSADSGTACTVNATALDPADFVSTWTADPAARPDVWLPDSSIWVDVAAAADIPLPSERPSVASSPVVLALADDVAAELRADGAPVGFADILGTRLSEVPTRVGLPDPRRSATAASYLLDVRAHVAGREDASAALTWALRSSPPGLPTAAPALLDGMSDDPHTAVPVSEQALWSHNLASQTDGTAVYPGETGSRLDYPYVVMSAAAADDAARFLSSLRTAVAEKTLGQAGFRDAYGRAGAHLSSDDGVDTSIVVTSDPPLADVVEEAIATTELSNQPSRMLALLDVSASMRAIVPDSGGATRLTLAKDAAARGLSLYPPDSELGLWTFSTHLTPDSDHHELVPVGPLTPDASGATGHERIAAALETTQVKPFGGTGLYDTVLEAVRRMRAEWDPTRINSVIVLSDGQNDDDGISLVDLLAALQTEQDPNRPVPVISIAFGPDSDVAAMSQISAATGGSTYVSEDPRTVGEIFFDAVGQRLCRPEC